MEPGTQQHGRWNFEISRNGRLDRNGRLTKHTDINGRARPQVDHFWKLRCRKSSRGCGAKQISKLKVYKTHQNTSAPDHFWKLTCRKRARHCAIAARRTCGSQQCKNLDVQISVSVVWPGLTFSWQARKIDEVSLHVGRCQVRNLRKSCSKCLFPSLQIKKI